MKIFDIVKPKDQNKFVLHSGSGIYNWAIVMQIKPLVLISVEGDMLWRSSLDGVEWDVIGHAYGQERATAVRRFELEYCKHEWTYDWIGMTLSRKCSKCLVMESRIINQTVMAELWPGKT